MNVKYGSTMEGGPTIPGIPITEQVKVMPMQIVKMTGAPHMTVATAFHIDIK